MISDIPSNQNLLLINLEFEIINLLTRPSLIIGMNGEENLNAQLH